MDVYNKVSEYIKRLIHGYLFDTRTDNWSAIFASIGYEDYILFEYGQFGDMTQITKQKSTKSGYQIQNVVK